ncbi:two component system hybrid sensor protein [Desulfobacula toluolica Tol2]|uniref:histidine kinase n=2 Tax=Desulfobacula toluolica TaxID=28223 RepID=K0NCT8_DESTT|nr:two component system hybrid sensor protein [Desulfobacula toluolica Tol2]
MKTAISAGTQWTYILLAILFLSVISLTGLHNYLLFHCLTELFSIVISCGIFMIIWNSKTFFKNNYIILLGIACLFSGSIDMLHMLSYKGMEVFKESETNLPTQLWIAARYIESLTLLMAPLLMTKELKISQIFYSYFFLTALLLASIFYWNIFPDCFVDGIGMTHFKKTSEYIIVLILIGSIYLLFQKRHAFDPSVYILINISIALKIAAELAFTAYINVYDFSNMLGHIFKIISFYLIYRALIHTGLVEPYRLMFKEISEKENRYRQIFETNQAVKLIINPADGSIVEANKAACLFYGYPKEKFISLKITDINTLTPEKVSDEMNKALSKNKLVFRFSHRLASGKTRDVEVYSGPIEYGQETFLYSIIHDITQRKKAETALQKSNEALRKSEEKFRLAFRTSPDAINLNSLENGTYMDINDGFTKILGYTREDIIGKSSVELNIWNNLKDRTHLISDLKKHGLVENLEANFRGKDGQIRTGLMSARLLMIDNKETILSITRDITEKGMLEAKLRQSQKMEAIGTLAGGIAHDFNNILFPILGHSEMLLEDISHNHPLRPGLEGIYTAALRAKELVKQILTFSRQNNDELKLIKIQHILKEVLKLIRSTIPTTIEIIQDISNNCGTIKADPTQIHQLIMNLATNAYHAMEKTGGKLTVSLQAIQLGQHDTISHELKPGAYACLTIADTGIGMDKELQKKIFDPFFTTKDKDKGTGLGLSVVHGIMKSHGGAIKVYSESGKGSTFRVYFPLIKKISAPNEMKTDRTLLHGTENILLVDDEQSILSMGTKMLNRLGYKVFSKTSSIEALEMFRSEPYAFDLVITDMTMPKLPGDILASELIKIRRDIPIIICTGLNDEKTLKQIVLPRGVKEMLFKPIVMTDLSQKIRKILDNREIMDYVDESI